MQSDYHRRFHQQARQYLDPSTFAAIHLKARGSTGGAAPRTPKEGDRQQGDEVAPQRSPLPPVVSAKEPVQKSALDTIRGMWESTLAAITGKTVVEQSGLYDSVDGYGGVPRLVGPSVKNTQNSDTARKRKKRVTKSALDALADAVTAYDGVEPDGQIAIQLASRFGRTKGAIGIDTREVDNGTLISPDMSVAELPFPDASVNQIYIDRAAMEAGLDLDAYMPEIRRISAPGARIYTDCNLQTVNLSGEWDESAHPRAENGQFGEGGAVQKKNSFAEATSHMSADDHRKAAAALGRLVSRARKEGNAAKAESYKQIADQHKEQFKQKSTQSAATEKTPAAKQAQKSVAAPAKATTASPSAPNIEKSALSESQSKALQSYQGVGFHDMNAAARGIKSDYTRSSVAEAKASVKQLNAAINQHEVKNDTVVYRGVTSDVPMGKFKPGDTIRERGFVSTSSDIKVANHYAESGGTIMHISLPKGSRALPVHKHINNSTSRLEKELILNTDSHFRVDKISHQNGQRILHVTLVKAA